MNKIITIEELKKLKEKVKENKITDLDYSKIVELFPDVKEEKPIQLVKKDNRKAGFSNIIYLATLSLVTEICFLALSLIIYK